MATREATLGEVNTLADFVNVVFRGDEGSWTDAKKIMKGSRTNASEITKSLQSGTKILVLDDTEEGAPYAYLGCVTVTPYPKRETPQKTVEIGMLSVLPRKQKSGIGSILMNAAFEYAKREWQAEEAVVGIINVREALIKWYEKMGFVATGETHEFHSETEVAIVPVVMSIYKKSLL